MSLVADEWEPSYIDGVAQTAASLGGWVRLAVLQAVHRRTRLLILVTLLERWANRGLTAKEIVRGLRPSPEAQRTFAGLLGAHNAATRGGSSWFRRDATGRWHPARRLRWEPWIEAAAGRR
jgi:hypothetical protein